MNITCATQNLLSAIATVLKAVSSRTTLPILECILLTADERGFRMTANDLEMGIETAPIEAQISQHGMIALEAKLFSEIIRKAEGQETTIVTEERGLTTIKTGSSEFKIMGQAGTDFPLLPEVEKTSEYIIGQPSLKNMIKQTLFSAAQEDYKPVLTGQLLEIKDGFATLVSLDGFRIALKKEKLSKAQEDISVVVPGKTMGEISKILSSDEAETVLLYITDKHILFDLGSSMVVSRLLEGEFVKYAQFFTQDNKTSVRIQRTAFLSAIERVSLISREAKKVPVKFEFGADRLVMSANTELGAANEQMVIETNGNDITIAFNPRYIIDALKAIEEETVVLQLTTSLSPGIFKPAVGDSYQYLVLPLRL